MNRRILFGILVIFASLICGCAGFVRSDVAVFHNLPAKPNTEIIKFAFLPVKGQESSLEYKTYAKQISDELSKYGYEETSIPDAEVVVAFFYGIDAGKEKIDSIPIVGQTGVSQSQTFGAINTYGNYGTYSGTTTYTPTYGVVGSQTVSRTEYARELALYIIDKNSFGKEKIEVLYQGNVNSGGSSSQIVKVMPAMIKSLFKEFPGKSGSTRRETFSIE